MNKSTKDSPKRFIKTYFHWVLNGCGMGPLLVLVSPCFRETVVVTWKIGSFCAV